MKTLNPHIPDMKVLCQITKEAMPHTACNFTLAMNFDHRQRRSTKMCKLHIPAMKVLCQVTKEGVPHAVCNFMMATDFDRGGVEEALR